MAMIEVTKNRDKARRGYRMTLLVDQIARRANCKFESDANKKFNSKPGLSLTS